MPAYVVCGAHTSSHLRWECKCKKLTQIAIHTNICTCNRASSYFHHFYNNLLFCIDWYFESSIWDRLLALTRNSRWRCVCARANQRGFSVVSAKKKTRRWIITYRRWHGLYVERRYTKIYHMPLSTGQSDRGRNQMHRLERKKSLRGIPTTNENRDRALICRYTEALHTHTLTSLQNKRPMQFAVVITIVYVYSYNWTMPSHSFSPYCDVYKRKSSLYIYFNYSKWLHAAKVSSAARVYVCALQRPVAASEIIERKIIQDR